MCSVYFIILAHEKHSSFDRAMTTVNIMHWDVSFTYTVTIRDRSEVRLGRHCQSVVVVCRRRRRRRL